MTDMNVSIDVGALLSNPFVEDLLTLSYCVIGIIMMAFLYRFISWLLNKILYIEDDDVRIILSSITTFLISGFMIGRLIVRLCK